MIILDLETNGLYPSVTKIHCAVAYDTGLDQVVGVWGPEDYDYPDESSGSPRDCMTSIEFLPGWLTRYAPEMSCHNGIGFDLKVLKKLYNYEYKGIYFDTLLASRILWPDIEPVAGIKGGKHSVAAWAHRLGTYKKDHDDWSEFSEAMLERCIQDVKVQAQLYNFIQQHTNDVNAADQRVSFDKAFRLEHKVWKIIERQSDFGWQFDIEKAFTLCDELEQRIKEIDDVLVPQLPIRVIRPTENITKAFIANGDVAAIAERWVVQQGGDVKNLSGDFSKVLFEQMNLNSDVQLKEYLLSYGWQPLEYNVKKDKYNKAIKDKYHRVQKTSPKLPKTAEDWAEVEEQYNIPNISLISERNKASHRLSQIKGLIDNTGQDHRIAAKANTAGTPTRRFAHSVVVNIPKARETVYYGTKMRSLFIAGKDKVLVGCDAHALEARVEAHYIYPFDKKSALELIDGDIHARNTQIFGCDRDKAKGGKYAIGYGCSAPKLATTIGVSVKRAEQILEAYWEGNPGLKELKERLEQAWKQRGYILSIDRVPLSVRYKHALINTLFQSAGSILMKAALCIAFNKASNIAESVGNFHDEMIFECYHKDAENIAEILKDSIKKAGELFNLNVPLIGESKIGGNWSLVH